MRSIIVGEPMNKQELQDILKCKTDNDLIYNFKILKIVQSAGDTISYQEAKTFLEEEIKKYEKSNT